MTDDAGRRKPSSDEEADAAWQAMLDRPATRGELLHFAQLFQLALLSQSTFSISLIDGQEAEQRKIGEKTVEHAMGIGTAMRHVLNTWKAEL